MVVNEHLVVREFLCPTPIPSCPFWFGESFVFSVAIHDRIGFFHKNCNILYCIRFLVLRDCSCHYTVQPAEFHYTQVEKQVPVLPTLAQKH